MKPNFFILGAAKCGTTSLYHYLGQHPDVCVSVDKEPGFFERDAEYERGLGFYWDKYFNTWAGETTVGEANPLNIYLPYVADRLKRTVPEARLIMMLRNPVERAFSHWGHGRMSHKERLSFEDALAQDVHLIDQGLTFEGDEGARRWVQNLELLSQLNGFRTYLDTGYYSHHIIRYLKLFPRDQIKIIFLEDMSHNPRQVVDDVLKFLGVDSEYTPFDTSLSNEGSYRSVGHLLERSVRSTARSTKLKRFIPRRLRNTLSETLSRIGPRPKMNPKTRAWLVDHYYPFNRELEEIVGRDLKHWDH